MRGDLRVIISRKFFVSIAAFWIVLIPIQYYFMYKKFNSVGVCREQHRRVDALQAQIDKTQTQINGLKKKD
jgi:hypothetical protein